MYDVFQVWDHLIDGDEVVPAEHINNIFSALVLYLPRNSFYNQHFGRLYPLVANAVANWHISNELRGIAPERGWVLKDGYFDVVREVATITGGAALALSVGVRIHQFLAADNPLKRYLTKWSDNGRLDFKTSDT
jgi:hypothetical protein